MSFEIQAQSTVTLTALSLFATQGEEAEANEKSLETLLPNGEGGLKTNSKQHTLTSLHTTTCAKKTQEYVEFVGLRTAHRAPPLERPSLMHLASTLQRPQLQPFRGEIKPETLQPQRPNPTEGKSQTSSQTKGAPPQGRDLTQIADAKELSTTKTHIEGRERGQTEVRQEKSPARHENRHSAPLPSRQWTKEETTEWWESRYHQKERQGEQKRDDRGQQQEEEKKHLRISKSGSTSLGNGSATHVHTEGGSTKVKKPELTPPKVGVFALYYLLTKMGILSDGSSNFAYKKEVELLDVETTETHKKRLEDLKEAIKKEKETDRWGVMAKVFSWIAFLIGMIAGIALIATGVGVVAGAMLVAGCTIQIGNQIMEMAGGWQKIVALLPGDDIEKKRALISWMQIGIGVLCFILSTVGVIWGGIPNFTESMMLATRSMTSIATMGQGVVTLGEGISGFLYKDKLADIKKFDLRLAQLKHMRQDLMEKVESGVDRLEKLFEDLALALDFEVELFQADQTFYRR